MKLGSFLTGLGIGAFAMYLLDPQSGKSRQSAIKDRLNRARNDGVSMVGRIGHEIQNRAIGVASEVRAAVHHGDEPISDEKLMNKVRSELGHFTKDLDSLDITCREGDVTLRGKAKSREVQKIVRAVKAIPGIASVVNELEVVGPSTAGKKKSESSSVS